MELTVSNTNFPYRITAFGERNFGGRFRMGKFVVVQDMDMDLRTLQCMNGGKILEFNVRKLANIYNEEFGTGYAGNVWDPAYFCPSLTTSQGGGRVPMVMIQVDDSWGCDR